MDPLIVSAIVLSLLFWAVLGGLIYEHLKAHCPPDWVQQTWFAIACGPAAWGLSLLAAWRNLRTRVLQRYGVAGFSCCAAHTAPRGSCAHKGQP